MADDRTNISMAVSPHHALLSSIPVRDLSRGNHRIVVPGERVSLCLNTRSHRKRRQPVVVPLAEDYARQRTPSLCLWRWQPHNLSWWVPFLFTLGSMVWLINGLIAILPVAGSMMASWVMAFTALAGGFIFILGAYAAFLEVINRPEHVHVRSDGKTVHAHHSHHPETYADQPLHFRLAAGEPRHWGWWLNTLQLIGALVFFIACVSGVMIPAHDTFNETRWYWSPQMIGAVFFMLSSIMAMLEMQEHIWQPAWKSLGWLSAATNLIGAIGFFLCAWYGATSNAPETLFWGSALSTFWGSIAFLASSYLMMLEVINPVRTQHPKKCLQT